MDTHAVDLLLTELRLRAWDLRFYGRDRSRLTAIVALLRWPRFADVLVLRGEFSAVAYRAPADEDILSPLWVTWWYGSSAMWTMRAVLTLEPPATAGRLIPAPARCGIPPDERCPVTVRPARKYR